MDSCHLFLLHSILCPPFFKKVCLFICLFVCLWLSWVSVAARGLSLVAASGGYSLLQCTGFSQRWLLLLQNAGSRRVGFSSCGTRAHVESSQPRARTCVPCIGRRILNCCATREAACPPFYESSWWQRCYPLKEIKIQILASQTSLLLGHRQ